MKMYVSFHTTRSFIAWARQGGDNFTKETMAQPTDTSRQIEGIWNTCSECDPFNSHARIYASGSVSFPRATPAYMRASVRVLNFAPYSVIDDRKYFVFGTEIFGRFRRFS
ncbi:hypothetical protein J6590_094126 [Homalodisca vitripennis]|nr:hypothetical protein J6590_094126 [Homalodisca vitripennis]